MTETEAMREAAVAAIAAERDKAYRERAELTALLAALWPSQIRDITEDWPVIFIETPQGQLSWHIAQDDIDVFGHVPQSAEPASEKWDGHGTELKYERVAKLAQGIAARRKNPLIAVQGTADAAELERLKTAIGDLAARYNDAYSRNTTEALRAETGKAHARRLRNRARMAASVAAELRKLISPHGVPDGAP